MIRLGDGTEESHEKMQTALDDLIIYSGELTKPDAVDTMMHETGIAPDLGALQTVYQQKLKDILAAATLQLPEVKYMQSGGKDGSMHTEHLGYILRNCNSYNAPTQIWSGSFGVLAVLFYLRNLHHIRPMPTVERHTACIDHHIAWFDTTLPFQDFRNIRYGFIGRSEPVVVIASYAPY